MAEPKKLKAAYQEDLPLILEKLGIKEDFEKELYYCIRCGCTMTYLNIGVILTSRNDKIELVCNKMLCVEQSY